MWGRFGVAADSKQLQKARSSQKRNSLQVIVIFYQCTVFAHESCSLIFVAEQISNLGVVGSIPTGPKEFQITLPPAKPEVCNASLEPLKAG